MTHVKNFFVLSSVLLLTCTPFQLQSAPEIAAEAVESRRVDRIDVQVENLPPQASFDPKPVLEKLNTKVGDPFSPSVFDADLKTLAQQYDRVEPEVEVRSGEVFITLKVWLRPTIRSITWNGNSHIKASTLRKELGIKGNKTFNRVTFNKQFNKVKEYYVKKGYFESQLSYAVQPIPDTNEVDISIQVIEGRAGIVDDIIFSGFTGREKSRILEMIHTKKYNLFTSWLTGNGILQEEAIEQDRLTILNMLQNEGYGDARVDLQITNAEKEGRVLITLSAERGPLFRYGEVTFRGNTLFTDQEIENVFLVHPEELYSPEKLRATQEAIKDLYGRKGYIDTHVQFEAIPIADKPIYNINFEIEEGEQYKIGLIRIFGNEQTQTKVILRESLLTPGETFDSVRLKATQERLQNMGYFKNVNVYPVRSQDDQILGDNYRDIYIEVEEAPTGHASLFFGLSSGDGIFGGLDVTETNFNYKGLAKLPKEGPSALRGGGEYAHAKVTLGSKVRSYVMTWITPYFRETLWRVGFEGFLSQSQLQAKKYEIDSLGGSLFASYPLTPFWTLGTKYRAKHASIDVFHGAPREEKEDRKGTGNISAPSISLNFDSTDHITKPHNGFRSLMEVEFAGVGGNFSFLKYVYTNSFYQHLWKRGTMKYRWEAKFIQPIWWTNRRNDIPVSERFFLGGINSVRGIKDFDLGGHYPNTRSSNARDPKGGLSASVLSLEYNHEVFSILDAFVFIDAGSVTMRKFEINRYVMTYGGGVRVEIMNRMPITVGFGQPVNLPKHTKKQKVFFSMGGQF
ncbi:MAG: outer membrane protein assembly factor BamA [Rhabdochlamydiaceae bacterium]|nr:outer membrane protein assembly factor BamA [Rhabdochlamydiaceae bacterium]